MRKFILAATLSLGSAIAVMAGVPAMAADASIAEIYQAADSGHLDQAQQMITQVLADHPNSAKAHYVQSELYAREGKISLARTELGNAERLNPGLTDFSARSVAELKAQLGEGAGLRSGSQVFTVPARSAPHIPWTAILILALVIGGLLMLFRRRPPVSQYPMGSAAPGVGGGPGGGYPPGGYPPGYGPTPMGGGIGSGIAGGLASGLAVGAGVVAGEELAHHFLDGGRSAGGGVIPSAEAAQPGYSNSDMGGNDFGANDPGSWDDGGGSGGGGGGDDWS